MFGAEPSPDADAEDVEPTPEELLELENQPTEIDQLTLPYDFP